jgi:hypothetical protein
MGMLEDDIMRLTTVGAIITLALGILGVPLMPDAQPHTKIPLVGFLRHGRQADAALQRRLDAFRQGLRELGYIEGQNIRLEVRYSEGSLDRLPALAAEFVRLPVEVLVVPVHAVGRCGCRSKPPTTICRLWRL